MPQPGPQGPAAWDESWATQFREAGAPPDLVQQLNFTGAMGADATMLGQMLAKVEAEVEPQLAQFAHDHADEYKRIRGNPKVDRATLVQIAAGVNSGQIPKEQLPMLVDTLGKTQGQMYFDMLVKPMIVYSLIPGWGALRLAFAPFTDGRDPLTGERMFGNKMATAFTVLTAVAGAATLYTYGRGAMQVAQGHRLAAAGGDAALIAANEGYGALTGMQKVKSFLPGTDANRVFSGLSRLDQDLSEGIKRLQGVERELADNVMTKWRSGEISVLGDTPSKWTRMGFQPNTRGWIFNRSKPMTDLVNHGTKPAIKLDGRMGGKTLAAQIASRGVDFADDALKAKLGITGVADPKVLTMLRERTLGTAMNQLLDAKYVTAPTGFQRLFGELRPGPLQDAMWASQNVTSGKLGQLHNFAAVPKMVKFGVGGVLAAGAGYFLMLKPQLDAKAKAAEEAAKQQQAAAQQQAAGGTGAGGGAAGGQLTPELQAAMTQFAALSPAEQAQIIEEQYALIQEASRQPNLTPEQQGLIVAATEEVELFLQVVEQGAGGGGLPTGGAAPGAPTPNGLAPEGAAAPPAAPAPGTGDGTTPTFTAEGLGLA